QMDVDFMAIQDADTEYDPRDLERVYAPLAAGSAEVVFGSRFLQANPNLYPAYLWGNKLLTGFINAIAGGRLTDAYTGTKAMSVERWRALGLTARGFELEAEIAVKCLINGWRV